jgi:hypothetical protein
MKTTPTPTKTPRTNGAAARGASLPTRLDELVELDDPTLQALYAAASVPPLPDLSGDLRGRMLAWRGLGGTPAALLRALARSDRFPWRGKSFRHHSAERGDGDNRVFVDRFHLFRFTTSIGPSWAGAFDAVHLDYDHPGNPFFIRAIHDELRQLRPGLYLGQAWLVRPGTPRLVLHFGLERPTAS